MARIINTFDQDALGLYEQVSRDGREILIAAGATSVWNGAMATTPPLGGTIMGSDVSDSVCDTIGATHEVPNLIISGGSLFPTAGGGSPTFTLYALADRASHHVLAEWSHYAAGGRKQSRTHV